MTFIRIVEGLDFTGKSLFISSPILLTRKILITFITINMTNKKENNKLEEKTRPIKINYPEVKNILLRYGESRYRCGVAEGQGDLSPEDSYPHGSAYRDVDELISQYGEACREEERREIEETIVKTYRQHPMPSQQVILKTLNQDNNNNDE